MSHSVVPAGLFSDFLKVMEAQISLARYEYEQLWSYPRQFRWVVGPRGFANAYAEGAGMIARMVFQDNGEVKDILLPDPGVATGRFAVERCLEETRKILLREAGYVPYIDGMMGWFKEHSNA